MPEIGNSNVELLCPRASSGDGGVKPLDDSSGLVGNDVGADIHNAGTLSNSARLPESMLNGNDGSQSTTSAPKDLGPKTIVTPRIFCLKYCCFSKLGGYVKWVILLLVVHIIIFGAVVSGPILVNRFRFMNQNETEQERSII